MAKRRRDNELTKGPWSGPHIIKQLCRVGYAPARHGDHLNYEHPERPGKVQVSHSWTRIKMGGTAWRNLLTQTGYTKKELQRVFNGLDP